MTLTTGTGGALQVKAESVPAGLTIQEMKSVAADGPLPPEDARPTSEGGAAITLQDDGSAEGKRSLGASGHAVLLAREPQKGYGFVEAVFIYAARYGTPEPPAEDFHLYLLNEQQHVLADLRYPYSTVERGELRWYTLRTPSIEVPEKFYVALAFNPDQHQGMYIGLDSDHTGTRSSSYTGLPGEGFEPVKDGANWMVRAYLLKEPTKLKGVQFLKDWQPPKPKEDPFKDLKEVKYDSSASEGQQSYGGSGPAVTFSVADVVSSGGKSDSVEVKGFRLYASRYGSGFDPERTMVKVHVLDSNRKVVAETQLPYSAFSYKAGWVDVALPEPRRLSDLTGSGDSFTVVFDPEATQFKGIYFHYQKNPKASHSSRGTVTRGFEAVPDREWMIRAYWAPALVCRSAVGEPTAV